MNKKCLKIYEKKITDSHVCAASLSIPSTNVCGGDSGGPLVVDKDNSAVVYGISSWKRGYCGTSYGAVFTRVSSYLSWIKSHMESSTYKLLIIKGILNSISRACLVVRLAIQQGAE